MARSSLRSVLVVSAVAALAGLSLLPSRAAAQNIAATLGGEASSLPDVPFELPLQLDMTGRPEKLGSFVVRLTWDPAVLQIADGHNGTFGDVQVSEDSLPLGIMRLTGVNPAGVGGKMILGVAHARPL